MENFTNETLNTTRLPRFEEVAFSKLHPSYWNVVVINLSIIFALLGIALSVAIYNIAEISDIKYGIGIGYMAILIFSFAISRIAYKKKAFAFREHDVLFRNGIIATNTIIIPYNRIQHVALHEGWIARFFGLAKIEIFTAGGSSSDITIPGIEKFQAENIKQLLMGKIQKHL